jgi:predicted TIM-barrel fold metal-dependent hydrolase
MPPQIIDTHQHVWDLLRFTLPWLAPDSSIARNHLPADYLRAASGLNVVKTIYMEVAVAPSQHLAEAEYVLDVMKDPKNLTVAAVIGGRPMDEHFRDYVARFKDESRIKGVRQIVHVDETPAGLCVSDAFIRGVRILGEFGKSFDICIRPAELKHAIQLVDACPQTRFILDHCGNGDPFAYRKTLPQGVEPRMAPEQFQRDMESLGKRKNVICKISGIASRMAGHEWHVGDFAPVINTCLDSFGPDRVIFAGDWPVCTTGATLKQWVEIVETIVKNRPAIEQQKLFHHNAVKHYALD